MPRRFRALTAAFVVAAAAIAGAAYMHRDAYADSRHDFFASSQAPVATFNLPGFASGPQLDRRLVENALRNVEENYYKPVNAQILVEGEQHGLDALLGYYKVRHAPFAKQTATGDRSHDIALLEQNINHAQQLLGAKATKNDVTTAAIRGMMESLGDPYTVYLSKAEIDSLQESLQGGDFGGIGVYIVQDPKSKQILVDPIEGNPAFKAGIKPGDVIESVDHHSTHGLRLDAVEKMIRGRVGTVVAIGLRGKAGGARTINVTRGFIHVPSVKAKLEDGVEYVRLADFGTSSYDEVRKAMLDGKAHNAKGYILDLRNNGGGLLETAVQISSLFVPDGPIVSTIDRAGNKDSKDALHTSIGAAPLVLLVNKYTASASEITAGAVQDYKVGTVLGTRTFGKGVVQSIYNMPGGSALKITTARYVTPLGRDIHHKGIKPDVTVQQVPDPPLIDTPKDTQLAAAKKIILQNGK